MQKELFADAAPKTETKTKAAPPTDKPGFISSVWSFDEQGPESLYRWYGTLPVQLVSKLYSLYAPPGAKVLDPFLGSGTSLDAAAAKGVQVDGFDVNPLACMISEAKFAMWQTDVTSLTHSARRIAAQRGSKRMEKSVERAVSRIHPYVRKWFRDDSLRSIVLLMLKASEEQDINLQRIFLAFAAQTVREVANVDSRCTHHLVTKNKEFIDADGIWLARLSRVASKTQAQAIISTSTLPRIVQASAMTHDFAGTTYDFVLAHPPYLGVIHYHQIHRLATELLHRVGEETQCAALRSLNFDYDALKAADVSTDATDRYLQFVDAFAEKTAEILAHGGRCAVIIGDQRYRGKLRHPFTDFIAAFGRRGLLLEELFVWLLNHNGGMHVLRRGHFIDHNYILVFSR